jgi:5-methylcytosine-specific restriction protein A
MPRRKSLSATRKYAIFLDCGGVCHICGGKIAACEGWDIDHLIPLELGGQDDESNWRPAHRKCHRNKTAQADIPAIAKAKRRAMRHAGIRRKPGGRSFPTNRDQPWKKKITGEIVRRDRNE